MVFWRDAGQFWPPQASIAAGILRELHFFEDSDNCGNLGAYFSDTFFSLEYTIL